MSKHDLAKAMAEAFITKKRDSGEEFVLLKDDRPEWMQDIVRAAHDDMGPNDQRYSMIRECVDVLIEYDDWDDLGEAIDRLVDVYNTDRAKWLASHLDRGGYCNEAMKEGLCSSESDIWDILYWGEYYEYRDIMNSLVKSFTDRAEEEGDEEDDQT